jgi:hypothetical protein
VAGVARPRRRRGPQAYCRARDSTSAPGSIRRYEHDKPGAMLHVDVKQLGNIPYGGGWRYVGRQQGHKNRQLTPGKPKNAQRNPKMGHAYVHTVKRPRFSAAPMRVAALG